MNDHPADPPETAHCLPARMPDYCVRAVGLWPRLERRKLARARHDPDRVAALVARRTSLSEEAILKLIGASTSVSAAAAGDR